jgi:hypothetical protein
MRLLSALLLSLLASVPALAQDEPGVGETPTRVPAPPASAPSVPDPAPPVAAPLGPSSPAPLEHALRSLLLVRIHGESATLRDAAGRALRELTSREEARAIARRIAAVEPDPALRSAAAELVRVVGATAPAPPPPPRETDSDPDRTRVVYGPTAIPRQRHRFAWTIFNIGYWNFDYGLTRNVEIGMHTVPPIGVVAFLPHVKIGGRLSEHVHLGVQLTGGVLYPYIGNDDAWRIGVYGGGPILTIEAGRFQLNVAAPFYGGTVSDNHRRYVATPTPHYVEELRHETRWVATPNLGFSARVGRHVRLNLETYAILGDHDLNGEIWGVLYGVRFFGERIYGDVSFVIPIFPGVDEILKYLPTGAPLLTFGVLF